MEFQGWSTGLALRPGDYLGEGESLAAVVRAAGPYRGEALYLLALGTAATMARLHLGGIAGLRLDPGNVVIGPYGQAFFAPGPRDSRFPASDVRDWADVIVFAATGRGPAAEPDLDRLLPALRAVVDECRRADPGSRPSAVDLVRILLGHSGAARGATVNELLIEAERRTRPDEPAPYEPPPAPTPIWRRPSYLVGVAIGVLIVAVVAGAVTAIAGHARQPDTGDTGDVVGAIGRRTATFEQKVTASGGAVAADGRLSFAQGAATAYEMKLTCGNAPDPAEVSLAGNAGVAGGVPFDAARPAPETCVQADGAAVRRFSSPYTIKALLVAAGTSVSAAPAPGNGRTITGTAFAHRIRGEETIAAYAGSGAEGPVAFTLRVDEQGLPLRLKLHMGSRTNGSLVVETVYRDWRAFEAIEGATPNG
ncbi:hypothetical protein SAMN05444920_116184 [Nonomuraea solani]|uniref:Serine/threonine protein kinase n=1 Tax=Nonomuraea solani TaxID=1144553 RepID=A0A1H6EUD6_9ACTN|nr:hypothetical protein [Nonomuraea solani]SEH00449.1 hypothetical protein SAMN05444920_116184 [Nonomuraea solani]